jgi:predicted methyltransferase
MVHQKNKPVNITQFRWAGRFGPIRIQTHCDQCNLTTATLQDMMENELKGKNVELEVKPWLDNLFYCLVRGAWHAPIIMINGKKFYQFSEKDPLFDRDKLVEQVKKALES